jgi:hypothetical protein
MENKLSKPCWTCRNRHVQCDQTRMPCAKCLKAGLECSEKRPVRWVQGVAIRGKMQGHMYVCPADKPVAPSSKRSSKIVFKTHATRPSIRGSAVSKGNRSLSKSSIIKRRNTDDDPNGRPLFQHREHEFLLYPNKHAPVLTVSCTRDSLDEFYCPGPRPRV